MVVIGFFAYKFDIISNLDQLPKSEYIMMAFLIFLFLSGVFYCLKRKWETVYFVANTLPIWALICLGLTIYNSLVNAHEVSPEVAFNILKAAGLGILINAFGIFLMLWLKKLAYFMGNEHV